jgi:hypothetical protein
MKPLLFQLEQGYPLMVIPDTAAHLDGHTIITPTHSIFLDIGAGSPLISRSKESTLHLERISHAGYFGYITFELPGKLFTYAADGQRELNNDEVQEVIEHLSHIRDNPALWNQMKGN